MQTNITIIGNSTYLRIPAKLRKKMGITPQTEAELIEDGDGIRIHIIGREPVFPKIDLSSVKYDPALDSLGGAIGEISKETRKSDPRIAAILGEE